MKKRGTKHHPVHRKPAMVMKFRRSNKAQRLYNNVERIFERIKHDKGVKI